MNYLEGQIILKHARVMKWSAMINSGAYKLRHLYHGYSSFSGEDEENVFTDEEKLQDAMQTLDRHISTMSDLVDQLP